VQRNIVTRGRFTIASRKKLRRLRRPRRQQPATGAAISRGGSEPWLVRTPWQTRYRICQGLLERIDRVLAELLELRDEVAAFLPTHGMPRPDSGKAVGEVFTGAGDANSDLAPEHLIEITQAVERFNRPADLLRWICRKQGCGVKVGGRWQVSARRLERVPQRASAC